ncbi:MAG: hypothetical protein K8R25_02985, partial [Methanosarcinales archaeon]|nr:hypothetical protein [Methanosarcinales archaeon]
QQKTIVDGLVFWDLSKSGSMYAEKKQKQLYLTEGYTLKGQSEIRKLEAFWWEKIRLRMRHPQRYDYDIAEFTRMIDGIKNASEYYKNASEYSLEKNPQCVACSNCMSILSSVLDYILAITHQQVVSTLEVKIKEWNEQLSALEIIFEGREKGEFFIRSLRKLISCIDNLEKYKKFTMHNTKRSLENCQIELHNIALNIEGPLQDIIKSSANKIEKCKLKFMPYKGGTDIEPIKNITFLDKILNLIAWIIKNPLKSLIGFILTILASIITNYFVK